MMQIGQGRGGCPWRTEPQPLADGRIKHPARHDGDHTRRDFDVDHLAVRPPLAVLQPQSAAMQRMPAIVDDHLSPDMGRMSP
jgi:hypothetical protein